MFVKYYGNDFASLPDDDTVVGYWLLDNDCKDQPLEINDLTTLYGTFKKNNENIPVMSNLNNLQCAMEYLNADTENLKFSDTIFFTITPEDVPDPLDTTYIDEQKQLARSLVQKSVEKYDTKIVIIPVVYVSDQNGAIKEADWIKEVGLQLVDETFKGIIFEPWRDLNPVEPEIIEEIKVAFIANQGKDNGVLELIKDQETDLVLHLGNYGHENANNWVSKIKDILDTDESMIPYIGVVGAKDGNWEEYQQIFFNRLSLTPDLMCFVVDETLIGDQMACIYKNLYFVLSGVGLPPYTSGQSDFVKKNIQFDDFDQFDVVIDWKMCGWHKANFDLRVGSTENNLNLAQEFYDSCREAGALVMTGFENNYARSKLLTGFDPITSAQEDDLSVIDLQPGNTVAFVTGLGGQGSHPYSPDDHPSTEPWSSIYTENYYLENGNVQEITDFDNGVLFITFNKNNNQKKAVGEFVNINGQVIDSFEISTGELEIPLPGFIVEVKDEQAYIDAFKEIFSKAKETYVVTDACLNNPGDCHNQLLCEDARHVWDTSAGCVECSNEEHCSNNKICESNVCVEPEPEKDETESDNNDESGDSLFTFAVIGDFGQPTNKEAEVAELVNGWGVDFIVTTGDNTYEKYTDQTDVYWHLPVYYNKYVESKEFYPVLGNHDFFDTGNGYGLASQTYRDYFTWLPSSTEGGRRFYDFKKEHVHFIMLNGMDITPLGASELDSTQKDWAGPLIQNSDSKFQIVVTHYSPYVTSYGSELGEGSHTSNTNIQWPFKDWGADIILAGHNHVYEQLEVNGLPILVNGLGGGYIGNFGTPHEGSKVRYNGMHGAIKATVYENKIVFKFISIDGTEQDSFTLS